MRSQTPIRLGVAVAVSITGIALTSAVLSAQAQPDPSGSEALVSERIVATTANLAAGSNVELRVELKRWSTEDERTDILSAAREGPEALQQALRDTDTLGLAFTGDSAVGYFIRYAFRQELPGGGHRVVLATEPRLGSRLARPWRATAAGPDYPFSVIELRLDRNGRGTGTMSFAAQVVVDEPAGTVGLQGFDTAPVLLNGATMEQVGGSGRTS
ncbi:MAG: hypothetical protein HOP14_08150 [Acidobacteria bacterium]|nr:hypothetical protein [Acidobacteriota bacterium]